MSSQVAGPGVREWGSQGDETGLWEHDHSSWSTLYSSQQNHVQEATESKAAWVPEADQHKVWQASRLFLEVSQLNQPTPLHLSRSWP